VRRAAPAPALVKQDDSIPLGIEVPSVARGGSRSGAAMDAEHGLPIGVAADVPVDEISVVDVEQAGVVRLDRRIRVYDYFPERSISSTRY
jgi:hypothetical protein